MEALLVLGTHILLPLGETINSLSVVAWQVMNVFVVTPIG